MQHVNMSNKMEISNSSLYKQTDRLEKLCNKFQEQFGLQPEVIVRVPGRVNLIGEHIDYCGYAVHPMAIDQDFLVAVAKSNEPKLDLHNTNERYGSFDMDIPESIFDVEKDSSKWWNYFLCGVKGIFEEVVLKKSTDTKLVGVKCLIDGTIPPSAGLSSSSALVVSSSFVTLWAHGLLRDVGLPEVANICARSERFIGTQGGGMDQAIEVLARQGTAKLIEFNPLTATDVKLPEGATFVIANSLAEKNKAAGPEFNTRVVETRLAAKVLGKLTGLENWRSILKLKELSPNLSSLLKSAKEHLHPGVYTREELCTLLGMNDDELATECLTENTNDLQEFKLHDRAIHVFSEALRVYQFKSVCDEAAAETESNSLAALNRLGQLMFDSHKSCAETYQCSHVHLDQLVELSRKHGALGARLTGAGWGGCIVALVPDSALEGYLNGLEADYYSQLPAAEGKSKTDYLFATQPGAGAAIFAV